jgi:hypothetical protein
VKTKDADRFADSTAEGALGTGNLEIKLQPQEKIQFEIIPLGTSQMVTYHLAGEAKTLEPGELISIRVAKSQRKRLLFNFEFSEDFGGEYKISALCAHGRRFERTIRQLDRSSPVTLAFGLEGDDDEDL